MRNAAPGLRSRVKSKLDAHPIPKNDLAAASSPVRAPAKMPINPSQTQSQANCDWGVIDAYWLAIHFNLGKKMGFLKKRKCRKSPGQV